MARTSPVSWRLCVAAVAAIAAQGCERVAYWSGQVEETDAATGAGGGDASVTTTSTGATVSVDEAAVLRGAATCASALYAELATATAGLARSADASASTGSAEDRDAARAAWRDMMDLWERAEAIRVGPVGPSALPGGRGFRDEVYAWPMTSRCLVDQTLVTRAYEDVDFAELSLVNVRGLGAAEYLLFYEGGDNGCAPTTSINETGAWDAIDADELALRKRRYAAAVSRGVDLRARQIDAAWRDDGEGFASAFAASGSAGAPYASTHQAIQALFDGVIVVGRQLRDDKLAAPLNAEACADASCEAVEAPYAHLSARLARRQLDGVVRVFDGCADGGAVGFDDLLGAAGREDVSRDAHDGLAAAAAALEAVEGDDLASALADERDAVAAARDALASVVQVLETEVATTLALDVPNSN